MKTTTKTTTKTALEFKSDVISHLDELVHALREQTNSAYQYNLIEKAILFKGKADVLESAASYIRQMETNR